MKKNIVSKCRNWFLTINANAECFSNVVSICEQQEKCEYSLILHDKDNEEQPHYHICILFENARTFETMQKKFNGAHIEVMESKYKCFRYLLHLDDTDKYQYSIDEVIQRGNNVQYYLMHDEYIKLDTQSLLESIAVGDVYSLYTAVKLFGVAQTNTYKNLIVSLLESSEVEKNFVERQAFDLVLSQKEELNYYVVQLENTINELMVENRGLKEENALLNNILNERGLPF